MVATVNYDDVEVGTQLPAQTFRVMRADLVRYAGASGDFNIIHWNELDKGGHFAAWEQPDIFVNELRDCFRKLR